MGVPAVTGERFLELVEQSGLVDSSRLTPFRNGTPRPGGPKDLAAALVKSGLLTPFQAGHLLTGKHRGLVLGDYKLLEQIARGGMGTVFLAEHVPTKRKAAVKVLTPDVVGKDPLAAARFDRESRAAAALNHSNIVRLYDVGRLGEIPYYAMEYVEGQTLAQLVRVHGPLHFAEAADYVAQAAAGLQEAHEKGLVHRDIKPDNLIVDRTGTVKILDLGLARDTGAGPAPAEADPDVVHGTPDYIAPEQALNEPVDIRADVYSLGATFFTLITGRPPFEGTTAQKLMQHQLRDAPSLSKLRALVPAELSDVVGKMMAKKPADRYQTPAEVIEALAPWLGLEAVVEARAGAGGLFAQTAGNEATTAPARAAWFWPAVIGCVAFAAVVAVGIGLSLGGNRTEPTADSRDQDLPPAVQTPEP
jgi:serine/threonine protein kinase